MLLFRVILFLTMLGLILALAFCVGRRAVRKYRESGSLVREDRFSPHEPIRPWWTHSAYVWLGAMAAFCLSRGLAWMALLLVVVAGVLVAAQILRDRDRRSRGW